MTQLMPPAACYPREASDIAEMSAFIFDDNLAPNMTIKVHPMEGYIGNYRA
jgi:hypothetical protein